MRIDYDLNSLLRQAIGEGGISQEELSSFISSSPYPIRDLLQNRESFPLGWLSPERRFSDIEDSKKLAERYSDYDLMIVIGMGGSALGTRAIVSSLSKRIGRRSFELGGKKLVIIDNLDESLVEEALKHASGAKVLVNPVSKSGNTLEVITLLSLLLNELPEERTAVSVTTTAGKGALFKFAKRRSLPFLDIPTDIGGRFSALTNVSFFPLAFLGIETEAILQGAIDANKLLLKDNYDENPGLKLSALLVLFYKLRNKNALYLLVYNERLADFSDWWAQLLAESLGKKLKLDGKAEPTGLIPVCSVCPSAQHSILQLLIEGPPNSTVGFVILEDESIGRTPIKVKHIPEDFSQFHSTLEKHLSTIKREQYEGTKHLIQEAGRPNFTLELKEIKGETLGEFIQFWYVVVALLGVFLNINPFDQPSVEFAKEIGWGRLSGG